MAIKKVTCTIVNKNNETLDSFDLTYNQQSNKYEAAGYAPSTSSWFEDTHKYNVIFTATTDAGTSVSVDRSDATLGSSCTLRVKETVKPEIKITAPSDSAYLADATPEVAFKFTDNYSGLADKGLTITLDGTEYSYDDFTSTYVSGGADGWTITGTGEAKDNLTDVTISFKFKTALEDGKHTLSVKAIDNDDNESDVASIAFTTDTVAPTLTIYTPADKTSYQTDTTVDVTGITNDVTSMPVTLTITVNGTDQGEITVNDDGTFSKTVTLPNVDNGVSNKIVVTVKDRAGRTTDAEREVYVDTTTPIFRSIIITPDPVNTSGALSISVEVDAVPASK